MVHFVGAGPGAPDLITQRGSVSKMDVNNLTDIPVTQVDQLLQGKIAGVNIRTPLPRPELLRKSVYVVWVLSVPTVLR